MKVLVGAFNQEKALVAAFSVIMKPMDRFTALESEGAVRDNYVGNVTANNKI